MKNEEKPSLEKRVEELEALVAELRKELARKADAQQVRKMVLSSR